MLYTEVQINGKWIAQNNQEGFSVEQSQTEFFQASVRNNSSKAVKLGGFRITGFAFSADSGKDIRVYREGWTMPSPTGSRRYGECDFNVSDGYRRFCISDPVAYETKKPNIFSSTFAMVLNNQKTGENMLAGFITSANQFTRFQVELQESGLKNMTAYCDCDNILLEPGETVYSEKLLIQHGNDAWKMLKDFAAVWGTQMNAKKWDHVPKGWCSWYYYFSKVTEADVLENLDFCMTHKDEYPMEYFQIDDGYQPYLGDWLEPSTQFPNGIKPIMEKIAATGIKPGLWFAPFAVEKGSKLLAEHPEWMIHDENGDVIYPTEWRGNPIAILDATNPGAYNFLRDLFRKVRETGCVYIKLDFIMYEACTGGVYFDRKATRAQALRRGFEAIREGIGEDAFMLACTAPLGPVIGIVNACRIGTDITPYWGREKDIPNTESPRVPNVCRNIINRLYMHNKLWLNDPDVHIARKDNNELTENEIQLWTSALWLVGGLTLISDRFTTLTPERAALSKLLLAQTDVFETQPLDLFERSIPAIWKAKRNSDGAPFAGIFNFEDSEQEIEVDLAAMFGADVTLTDHWTGKTFSSNLKKITLPAHTCVVLKK